MNKNIMKIAIVGCGMLFMAVASAEGKDVLNGLMPDVKETITGTGKYLLYAAELVVASVAYIKTRNLTAFGGVGVLALFMNFTMGLM